MEVDIPVPNPAVAAALAGPEVRQIVHERADMAAMLLQAKVAKRTGALARSIHAHTEVGGIHNDRWVGVVSEGDNLAYYAASHEFGADVIDTHGKRHADANAAAHDLNTVLEQLDSM